MTISNKQLLPTSTSLQSRVRIFQATRRPKYMEDDTSTTAWGSVRVMGKLGQAHADVLESILFCAEDVRKKEGFGTKLLVDPYLIRKHSNIGSGEQMEKIMNELMAAVLTISTTGGKHNFTKGHIIESMIESKTADSINKLTGGNRKMWTVVLGTSLMELLEKDFGLNRDPRKISDSNSGLCQAAARHMLTHDRNKSNGLRVDTIIKSVCGPIKGCTLRNRRREFNNGKDYFSKLGLNLDKSSLTFA